jgi:hypothetical protein
MRVPFILAAICLVLAGQPSLANDDQTDQLRRTNTDQLTTLTSKAELKSESMQASDAKANGEYNSVSNSVAAGLPGNSTNASDGTTSGKQPVPLAKRAASFACGFIGGTPIACVRLGGNNACEVEHTIPLIGKTNNPVVVWPARAIVYPGCALAGLFEGPFYAWYKSRTMCGKEPFSRDAFSLGEIEKYELRCQQ